VSAAVPTSWPMGLVSADNLRRFSEYSLECRRRLQPASSDTSRFYILSSILFERTPEFAAELASGEQRKSTSPAWPREDDNLDTGNPPNPAPFAFNAAYVEQMQTDQVRKYSGPGVTPELADGLRTYLDRHLDHVLSDEQADGMIAGAGTTHLFDLICSTVLQRRGDVILTPEPLYGFFLPHAESHAGAWRSISPDTGSLCSAGNIARTVDDIEHTLVERWTSHLPPLVMAALADVKSRGAEMRIRLRLKRLRARMAQRAKTNRGRHTVRAADECFDQYVRPLLRAADLFSSTRDELERTLRAPRVGAFLLLNPAQTGEVYTQSDIDSLAIALPDVAIIEDTSYHSLRVPHHDLGSFLRTDHACVFYLFGMSKPFGLADVRIALLLAPRGYARAIMKGVERTLGWPSNAVQNAVGKMLRDASLLDHIDLTNASLTGSLDVMVRCLSGRGAPHPAHDGLTFDATLSDAVQSDRLLDLSAGLGLDAARQKLRFEDTGLSDYFDIHVRPTAGFFLFVDCQRLLARPWAASLGLATSLEVFSFLRTFVGIRTIPEEAMTTISSNRRRTLLRLSFAPDPYFIVEALFALHLVLAAMERPPDGEYPENGVTDLGPWTRRAQLGGKEPQ